MSRSRLTIAVLAILVLVLGFAASTNAAAPPRSSQELELQRSLERLVASGVPGAIALVRDGDRTIRVTSGYGHLASKTPLRATDRIRIGSITKTFVATVVLQLVGERKLSLDDSVEERLPGLVPNARNITIRQLLNMTSGLYNYLNDPRVFRPYLAGKFGYVWSPERLVSIALSHKPTFAPGTSWEYSNTNYVLLGLIVEKVTGHSLGAELGRRIFAPLHLRATSFDTQQRIAGRHSHGYYPNGKQLLDTSLISPSHGWAAGAIVSTADDVATFFRALSRGQLLRPELLRKMRTTVSGYGLGLGQLPLPCGTTWGHGGKFVGYVTDAWSSPDARRQFVLFANLNSDSMSKRTKRAYDGLLATAYCGSTSSRTELDRTLHQFLRAHRAFPGVALAVRAPGVVWSGAAGIDDLRSKKPLAPDATFRVASVAKTFTAAAILRLVEDGKLALDDPIARHLSKRSVALLRGDGYDVDAIRVRHLLQHTSGLYDFAEDPTYQAFVVSHPRHRWTRTEQVRFAMTHGEPLFKPGTDETYSDTGYVLLGEMLERVTGRGLAAAYRTLLPFDRLGLDETYLETLEPKAARAKPRAHQYFGTVDTIDIDPSFDLYGGGGFVSSLDDLARFFRALVGGRVFNNDATLTTMLGKANPVHPGDLGLGIFVQPLNGETCWYHNGFWGINVLHCPRSNVTIASMVNQAKGFIPPTLELTTAVHRLLTRT